MTTENDFLELDVEAKKAATRITSLIEESQSLSQDGLFTEAVAWSVLISLYLDSMMDEPDGEDMRAAFESIVRRTKGIFVAAVDHGLDEKKSSQGN